MIVTADPHGDFNATSQILRYSALAREITVPRIPSVTSTILAASTANAYFGSRIGSGRHSPSETERETMEIAALEIARMSVEIDGLRSELLAEQQKRIELEARLESAAERELEIETDVREQCYGEMEEQFLIEMERWKARWQDEKESQEEHIDRKLEILGRMNDDEADEEDKENFHSGQGHSEGLAADNERLRREVESLKRELHNRSPTKRERLPLRENKTLSVERSMEGLRISGNGDGSRNSGRESGRERERSPTKKVVRKLGGRKWGVDGEDD